MCYIVQAANSRGLAEYGGFRTSAAASLPFARRTSSEHFLSLVALQTSAVSIVLHAYDSRPSSIVSSQICWSAYLLVIIIVIARIRRKQAYTETCASKQRESILCVFHNEKQIIILVSFPPKIEKSKNEQGEDLWYIELQMKTIIWNSF